MIGESLRETTGFTSKTLKSPNPYWKHRMSDEKLQELSDAELLARMIHLQVLDPFVMPTTLRWARMAANDLLRDFGSIEKLSKASWRQISAYTHFNAPRAIQVRAAFLLARRLPSEPKRGPHAEDPTPPTHPRL